MTNLGLVELLRRQCPNIICIDASGDNAQTFATLKEAIDLALVELDCVEAIKTDFARLRGVDGNLPDSCIGVWDIVYASPTAKGTLYYAKAQVAASSPPEVRRYAHEDRTFPRYSTGKQFLSSAQFDHLVAAGAAVGKELSSVYLAHHPTPS